MTKRVETQVWNKVRSKIQDQVSSRVRGTLQGEVTKKAWREVADQTIDKVAKQIWRTLND